MAGRKRRVGLGVLLLFVCLANVGPWQTAKPDGAVEIATHYIVITVLFVLGLWFIFRKPIPKEPN